jgi:hypothetical protein
MGKQTYFPKGSTVLMTSGEYDDYRVRGALVFLLDSDLPTLVRTYEALPGSPERRWPPDYSGFVDWLCEHGVAKRMDLPEVFLGYDDEWHPELKKKE